MTDKEFEDFFFPTTQLSINPFFYDEGKTFEVNICKACGSLVDNKYVNMHMVYHKKNLDTPQVR